MTKSATEKHCDDKTDADPSEGKYDQNLGSAHDNAPQFELTERMSELLDSRNPNELLMLQAVYQHGQMARKGAAALAPHAERPAAREGCPHLTRRAGSGSRIVQAVLGGSLRWSVRTTRPCRDRGHRCRWYRRFSELS